MRKHQISLLVALLAATAGFFLLVMAPPAGGAGTAAPVKPAASASFDRAIAAHSQKLLAQGHEIFRCEYLKSL